MAKNITPRATDYSQWYLDVVKAARLADYAPVRGCMVIQPDGYAIWEAIQRDLDRRFKDTGHVNAYFPLLIPQSFLTREAEHVEGFAMECAVVTHSKLEKGEKGLKPGAPLEEPLIIRPTSETVIGHMYASWIQSYRDLPVLINQWCNVMRWEMRTRLFLRTAEFLWQEGHTAHETAEQAREETLRMLDVYADFAQDVLAIPVVKGRKTDAEKFPGAEVTFCIEALMQDGKALQMGTSHDLGQNFARAFDIKFLGRDQKQQYCYTTSWGVSTRLIGAMIMAHSDDEGLVVPPRLAPTVLAVVPIYRSEDEKARVTAFIRRLLTQVVGEEEMQAAAARNRGREIESVFYDRLTHQCIVVDHRDQRPGDKQYHWEQKGVPLRLEVGPRDVDQSVAVLKHRLDRTKETVAAADFSRAMLKEKLEAVQHRLLERARAFQTASTRTAASYDELKQVLEQHAGFVRCRFVPDREVEKRIKEETKATVRCIPLDQPADSATAGSRCIVTGREGAVEVLFAQAY
ncbi:MAG: proline--tRNA ligase [Tepidisphaerales bacterium]